MIVEACFIYGMTAFTRFMAGFIGELRDDIPELAGEALLWPIYGVRFILASTARAIRALFAPL